MQRTPLRPQTKNLLHPRTQGPLLLPRNPTLGQIQIQTFFSVFVNGSPFTYFLQAVSHEHFVVGCCEEGGGYVDEDGDPGVGVVGEGFAAEEDQGDEAGAEVTGHVCAYCDVCERPYHSRVCEA